MPGPDNSSSKAIGFTGGLISGGLSYIGGYLSGLNVPISPSLKLTKIGSGICIKPPPFELAAVIGLDIGAGVNPFEFDGLFKYINSDPWEVKVRGALAKAKRDYGSGGIGIRAGRSLDFDVNMAAYLPRRDDPKEEKAKALLGVEGELTGWMEYSPYRLNIYGSAKVCALNVVCASGEAVVSTRGIGGCVKLTSIPYPFLEKTSEWSWRRPWPFRWVTRYRDVSAGGGYQWGGEVSSFAASCDVSDFQEKRSTAIAGVAAGVRVVQVPRGQVATTFLVDSLGRSPRVVLISPSGKVIAPHQPAELNAGHYDYIEDTDHSRSSIIVAKPEPGRWQVRDSNQVAISAATLAEAVVPPSILAQVGQPTGDTHRRVLGYAILPEPGRTVLFVERGPQGVAHDIGTASGSPCGHGDDSHRPTTGYVAPLGSRCGEITFHPAEGPAGEREIIAIVSDHGIPVHEFTVTTHAAPAEAPPAPIHGLHLRREGTTLAVNWSAPAHSDILSNTHEYNVVLKTNDGLEETVITEGIRTAFFPDVPLSSAATVSVVGLRDDLGSGHGESAQLAPQESVPRLG